jgi:hypothetical protein
VRHAARRQVGSSSWEHHGEQCLQSCVVAAADQRLCHVGGGGMEGGCATRSHVLSNWCHVDVHVVESCVRLLQHCACTCRLRCACAYMTALCQCHQDQQAAAVSETKSSAICLISLQMMCSCCVGWLCGVVCMYKGGGTRSALVLALHIRAGTAPLTHQTAVTWVARWDSWSRTVVCGFVAR